MNPRKLLAVAFVGLLVAGQPDAHATIVVGGDTDSYVIIEPGSTVQPDTFGRVGSSGPGDTNVVMVFGLPVLGALESVVGANVEFRFFDIDGTPSFNVDLWGIGFQGATTALAEFFDLDTGDTGNTKIQDDILTTATADPNGFTTNVNTDATGDANLASYLQGFYDVNPGYGGGSFVSLRLNQDSEAVDGGVGYEVGLPNGGYSLALTVENAVVREPSTLALAMLGVPFLVRIGRSRSCTA